VIGFIIIYCSSLSPSHVPLGLKTGIENELLRDDEPVGVVGAAGCVVGLSVVNEVVLDGRDKSSLDPDKYVPLRCEKDPDLKMSDIPRKNTLKELLSELLLDICCVIITT